MDSNHPASPLNQGPDLDSLEREVRSLRRLVQIMLVSLVILSGSLAIYLFRQVSLLRRQALASERMAAQMAQHFNSNLATQGMMFEKQLTDFARTNPAFQARITRFFANTSAVPDQATAPPNPAR